MKTDLREKIALVTGASSGLGAQFARVLAANGAQVILAARRVERLQELRAEIESQGGAADVVALDVSDLESIAAAIANALVVTGAQRVVIAVGRQPGLVLGAHLAQQGLHAGVVALFEGQFQRDHQP